ncbi:MAG: phage portal protein [Acidobacteria bacterium]|nr:phage portal protein [Acidobacteriota bacterium]
MNIHIEEAIESFRGNAARYARSERYYGGNHDLAFATDKFRNAFGSLFREFALNLCPAVCEAVRDKLRVVGFGVDGISAGGEMQAAGVRSDANRIWNANRMRIRAGEVHREVLICADAYMIVWPDAAGNAVMYPNGAGSVTVTYDDEQPGTIARAAKYWRGVDKRIRLNLFYPDSIEKYVSKETSEGSLFDAAEFVPFVEKERTTPSAQSGGHPSFVRRGASEPEIGNPQSAIRNPYGIVPVFHFANNAGIGAFGRSELEAAIPIQDGLNKSMLDMLVAMEYSAFRQRWAAGIEVEVDNNGKVVPPFTAGIDHLWISQNADATFGDFATANLEQFLKVKDSFRGDIASVTGTPLHYFMQSQTRNTASGEALRKAETRFIAKVRDRQESFGQIWADAMQFALTIEGKGSGVQLITDWEDPAPMSDKEFLENILLKKQIGLPVEQALIEAGYGEADVKAMVTKAS